MKKMLYVILLIFIVTLSACSKDKETELSDETVYEYNLSVELNDVDNQLQVEGNINFENYIDDLTELKVMLYGNGTYHSDNNPNIESLTFGLNDNDNIPYVQDGYDDQVITIQLEKTYQPDEVITVSFSYVLNLWDDGRMSYREDAYYAMFFYPIIAEYDDNWNIEPYSFRGEVLYTKMASFDVDVIVPEDYIVAMPNQINEEVLEGGKKLYESYGDDLRDFSFSASKNYEVYEKDYDGLTLKIFDKGNHTQSEINTYFSWMEKAFETYENYIGDYYLNEFVLELGDIYGMESSGIIYCSSDVSEGTIVHEIVHQWFFFMIGSDQFDESFLDESLTTYTTSLYFREMYGEVAFNQYLDGRSSLQPRLSQYYTQYEGLSLDRTVFEIGDGYAFIIYYHGPTLFRYYVDEMLDGDVEKFYSALQVYYEEFNRRNATIDEFLDLLEDETNVKNTKEWFLLHISEIQDLANTP